MTQPCSLESFHPKRETERERLDTLDRTSYNDRNIEDKNRWRKKKDKRENEGRMNEEGECERNGKRG